MQHLGAETPILEKFEVKIRILSNSVENFQLFRHRIFYRQPIKYPIGYMTGQILSPVKDAQS